MKKKVIAFILGTLFGGIVGGVMVRHISNKRTLLWKEYSDKHLSMFLLMNEWIKIKQEKKNIKKYFETRGYKTIAVYGLSYIGERLIDELEELGLEVKYGIDKKANKFYSDIEVYAPEDQLPMVDVIIVSAIYYFDEIKELLEGKVNCPIVSLEDILYDIY